MVGSGERKLLNVYVSCVLDGSFEDDPDLVPVKGVSMTSYERSTKGLSDAEAPNSQSGSSLFY